MMPREIVKDGLRALRKYGIRYRVFGGINTL